MAPGRLGVGDVIFDALGIEGRARGLRTVGLLVIDPSPCSLRPKTLGLGIAETFLELFANELTVGAINLDVELLTESFVPVEPVVDALDAATSRAAFLNPILPTAPPFEVRLAIDDLVPTEETRLGPGLKTRDLAEPESELTRMLFLELEPDARLDIVPRDGSGGREQAGETIIASLSTFEVLSFVLLDIVCARLFELDVPLDGAVVTVLGKMEGAAFALPSSLSAITPSVGPGVGLGLVGATSFDDEVDLRV